MCFGCQVTPPTIPSGNEQHCYHTKVFATHTPNQYTRQPRIVKIPHTTSEMISHSHTSSADSFDLVLLRIYREHIRDSRKRVIDSRLCCGLIPSIHLLPTSRFPFIFEPCRVSSKRNGGCFESATICKYIYTCRCTCIFIHVDVSENKLPKRPQSQCTL